MTTLRGGAATDVGRVRQINEDRHLCDEGIYAVADGVGGHQAGEVAAQTAVETLAEAFTEHTTVGLVEAVKRANEAVWELAQTTSEKRGMGTTITAVAWVVSEGEEMLSVVNVGDSRAYRLQDGEMLQLTDDHSLVEELVREGRLTREEALVHPQRSIITRALGMEPDVDIDWWELIPYQGDRILLCSDGVTNELTDDRIAATLRQVSDPQEAARELVRLARGEGGSDNATVVVVDVVDDDDRAGKASAALAADDENADRGDDTAETRARPGPSPRPAGDSGRSTLTRGPSDERHSPYDEAESSNSPEASPGADVDPASRLARPPGSGSAASALGLGAAGTSGPPAPPPRSPAPKPKKLTWRVAGFVVLVAGVIGGTVSAISWYARSTYYVGFAGDDVAVYQGRPGGILWFDPTLSETTTLKSDEVPDGYLADVEAGVEVGSKAEAERFVSNLRSEHLRQQRSSAATSTTTSTIPADAASETEAAATGGQTTASASSGQTASGASSQTGAASLAWTSG